MESNDMKFSCLENDVKELRKLVEQKRQMENEYDNALKLLKTHFQTLTLRWEAHDSIEYIFGKKWKSFKNYNGMIQLGFEDEFSKNLDNLMKFHECKSKTYFHEIKQMLVKCLSLRKSNSLDYEKHSQMFTTCAKMTISDYQTQLSYCLNNLEMVINARTFLEKELQIKQQNVIKRKNDINSSHEIDKSEGQWSNNELFENVFDHNNEVEKTNEDIKALKEANVLLTKDLKMYQERLLIFRNKLETVLKRDYDELQTQLLDENRKTLYQENKRKIGLGYTDPCPLGQAIACHPKLYDAEVLGLHYVKLDVHDAKEILNDAEESQVKMKEKQFHINYEKNLYDTFVPQTELSSKQEYFSNAPISSESESSKDMSDLPVLKMPNESRLLKMFDKLGDALSGFYTKINKTLLKDAEGRWLSDNIKEELIEDVQEMLNIFESMESKVDITSKKNENFQNKIDQLMEAYIANDVKNLVMQSYKSGEKKNLFESKTCVFQIKIAELEKTLAKQTKENSDLLIKIDNLENAFVDETKDFDDVKFELSNRTAKFEAYFEKLENTKVVLERQLARKVDDFKAEKDQFLKELNHLRIQLENLKGKSVKTMFDKSSILGKSPADKLLITSQLSKSWSTSKVVVQKGLSKPVTTQSLPRNEKDQLLKRIASLESKLASQDIRSCQKEYHELRNSYNALKVKFDSLNRTKRKTNVSKSSKPKVGVSKKVHTGEFSKPFSKRVYQFTTYSLQKDRKFSKKSQSFKTPTPQKVFKISALKDKNQVFVTSHSRFTPVKQVWRQKKSHSKSFKYSKTKMLSMQNKNDSALKNKNSGRFSNDSKMNFQNVASNVNNKWKFSSSTRFKLLKPSFNSQWKIKRNFKSLLIPRELFSNETPVSSPCWNSTSYIDLTQL
ncbi:hypothetical protein Tco_0305117 [Tanacetum coccineum]